MMYTLVFLEGKYQGGEYPLAEDTELLVGRDSDLDMVLVSDEISRRHARFVTSSTQRWVEPLSPAHSILVNDVPITTRTRLFEADRIRMGTHVMVLRIKTDQPVQRERADILTRSGPRIGMARAAPLDDWVDVESVPLVDLMHLASRVHRDECFIEYEPNRSVGIYLKSGRIHGVSFQDERDPHMAFARILALEPARWRMVNQWPQNREEILANMTPLDMALEDFVEEVLVTLKQRVEHIEEQS